MGESMEELFECMEREVFVERMLDELSLLEEDILLDERAEEELIPLRIGYEEAQREESAELMKLQMEKEEKELVVKKAA